MYDTPDEAQQKLANSAVLFDGLPVWISGIKGTKNKVVLDYISLPLYINKENKVTDSISIEDSRWDFKSLGSKLGYVNITESPFDKKHEAVFVTRIPSRSSRQGLDDRTAKVSQFMLQEFPWQWSNIIYYNSAVMSVMNKFPKAPEAVRMLLADPDKIKSVAISKKLMLMYDKVNPPNLVYRNEKIGYTESGELFKLAAHKKHLAEELTDMEYLKIA